MYYVWLRGIGKSSNDDSAHVGLNYRADKRAARISNFFSSMDWSNTTMSGARARIYVPSAGTHVLNVWMREDGFILDKILLTTDASRVPDGSGELPRMAQITQVNSNADALVYRGDTVRLSWRSPTVYSDMTPMTDLAGFLIYMSDGKGDYTKNHIIANIPSLSANGGDEEWFTLDPLSPGTYYFTVTAYNTAGNESGFSKELVLQVQ